MSTKKPDPTPEELLRQYAPLFLDAGWLPQEGVDEAIRQRVEATALVADPCKVCGHKAS